MRASAYSFAILLVACGNAERNAPGASSGGTSGSEAIGGTNAGHNGVGEEHRGGASHGGFDGTFSGVSGGGGSNANGAAAGTSGSSGIDVSGSSGTIGGSAQTGGGGAGSARNDEGGETGQAGQAGETGQAGATAACGEPYLACGCGCCGGAVPTKRCYYPEVDGHEESVIAEDSRVASSPSCVNAGCSVGVEYVCCTSDRAIDGQATYEASTVVGGLDRLTLSRAGADGRCASVVFVNPSAVANGFLIENPQNWPVESAREGGCTAGGFRNAMGGFGRVDWGGSPCVLDFEFTLFFPPAPGSPDAVKFVAQNVPVAELGSLQCD